MPQECRNSPRTPCVRHLHALISDLPQACPYTTARPASRTAAALARRLGFLASPRFSRRVLARGGRHRGPRHPGRLARDGRRDARPHRTSAGCLHPEPAAPRISGSARQAPRLPSVLVRAAPGAVRGDRRCDWRRPRRTIWCVFGRGSMDGWRGRRALRDRRCRGLDRIAMAARTPAHGLVSRPARRARGAAYPSALRSAHRPADVTPISRSRTHGRASGGRRPHRRHG
jgi:hypothetical protein